MFMREFTNAWAALTYFSSVGTLFASVSGDSGAALLTPCSREDGEAW